ncbi:hypothetical protein DBR40_19950 [Pedobacter sp. KBW01]|uniref:hypothetical protein n=1 Tax=Pedobacter sp. KBW01 TaxID=2153364 RepID=UPI000F5992F9|nr:hypothetical protein [Pedobacter sp. KBW01]RQO68517.1 hypothetical protein DBR40_19950 [Pedobacter sp. KBW01]
MAKEVSQKEYVAHHENLLFVTRKKIADEFSKLSYLQINALEHRVKDLKKKIGFAKSGIPTAFYIDG